MQKYETYELLLREYVRNKAVQLIEEAKRDVFKKLEDSLEEVLASVAIETLLRRDIATLGDHFHVHITKK